MVLEGPWTDWKSWHSLLETLKHAQTKALLAAASGCFCGFAKINAPKILGWRTIVRLIITYFGQATNYETAAYDTEMKAQSMESQDGITGMYIYYYIHHT